MILSTYNSKINPMDNVEMLNKISEFYRDFCDKTGRSGGVLVHSSIKEWHKYLAIRLTMEEKPKEDSLEIVDPWPVRRVLNNID